MNLKALFGATGIWLVIAACAKESIPQPDSDRGNPPSYADHPQNNHYLNELKTFSQTWNSPGTILLIKKADEPVWIGAVGKSNLAHQTNLRTDDPFRTGSITKTFVATVVMKLQEQNKLHLDDTLGRLLPDVASQIPNAMIITLRQLLSHTSGIFDPTNNDLQYKLHLLNDPARRMRMTTDEVLATYVYGRSAAFLPGERYGYSNTNYWLIGKVVEAKTGQKLPLLLDQLICKPLGLSHTYLELRDDRNVVRGYNDFYANGKLMDVTSIDRADSDGQANAGIISTASDLFTFSEALFSGGVISLESVKQMTAFPAVRSGKTEYGLGLDSYESPLGLGWGHNGTLLGVDANWFYFPEKRATYILFANNGGGADKSFVHTLLQDHK